MRGGWRTQGVLIAAVLLAGIGGAAAGGGPAPAASAHQPRQLSTSGRAATHARNRAATAAPASLVFSDRFHDPLSGWGTHTLPSGTRMSYGRHGYVIQARGSLQHFSFAPYAEPLPQLAVSVRATQSADAPAGAGFGVLCQQGLGRARIAYQFLVVRAAAHRAVWVIQRYDGLPRLGAPPVLLREGTSPRSPGRAPLTVTGVCVSHGRLTHLRLLVDGVRVGQVTDITRPRGLGWTSGIAVVSQELRPSTVVCSLFQLRTVAGLSRPA